MHPRWSRLILVCCCTGLLLAAGVWGARAQAAAARAAITAPQTDNFPLLSTYLDVRDAEDRFVSGLQPVNLRVLENNRPLDVAALAELRPGAQLVIAVAPGRSLAILDTRGRSRYDYLTEALNVWATTQAVAGLDDVSLIIEGGPQTLHLPDPADLPLAFAGFQLDDRSAVPTLDSLTRAIQLASDLPQRPGMGRVVLFITSPPESDVAPGLQSLTEQAQRGGVRVVVWLAAATDVFETPAAAQLRALAEQTGGEFFGFSGGESIPLPENYLEALRSTYVLTYTSAITQSGAFSLAVEVDTQDFHAASAAQEFSLTVLPPNPILIPLPAQIQRSAASVEAGAEISLTLSPSQQGIDLIIEFPDGHPRALARTALYVDGALMDENLAPPWEQLTWDLSGYQQDGSHLLRLEATDSLGLTGSSIETPVQITVRLPTRALLTTLQDKSLLLILTVLIVVAAFLFTSMVLSGRLRPRYAGQTPAAKEKARKPSARSVAPDPGSPPSPTSDAARLPHWMNRLHWPHRHPTLKTLATLTALDNGETPAPPISIVYEENTLGRDPQQCTLALDDLTIEACHARLWREGGRFYLADAGTVAGAWVNYLPANENGLPLEHGDLVCIGRLSFRFLLRDDPHPPKPVILPLEEAA